jgi:hypothetical protein
MTLRTGYLMNHRSFALLLTMSDGMERPLFNIRDGCSAC